MKRSIIYNFSKITIKFNVILVFLLFLLTSINCYGLYQNVDSLKVIAELVTESEKPQKYLNLAEKYKYSNFDSALIYSEKVYELAVAQGDIVYSVKGLILRAWHYNIHGNFTLALNCYKEAEKISLEAKNKYLIAYTYLELSEFYRSKFNYYNELEFLDSTLYYVNRYKISSLAPETFLKLTNLYIHIDDIQLAKHYSDMTSRALDINYNEKIFVKDLQQQAVICLLDNEKEKALEYYYKALDYSKKIRNASLIQMSYRGLSKFYIEDKQFVKAVVYIDSSISICEELNYKVEESALITYKAHIAWLNKDYNEALKYNKKALKIRQSSGNISAVCSSLLNIGGNYILLSNLSEASKYLKKGLEIALKQKNLTFISNAYKKLSELNAIERNYKTAFEFEKLSTIYRDSVNIDKTNDKIFLFSNLYESEKEKRLLEKIELRRKSNNVIFLSVVIFLAMILILLLYRNNYVKRKSTREIVKLSKVIEAIKQAVVIIDNNRIIQYVNNGFIKLAGIRNRNDVIGKNVLDFVSDPDSGRLVNNVFPELKHNMNWAGEIVLKKSDGTEFYAEVSTSILERRKNRRLYVALFHDISIRKRHEKELKESKEILSKTIETQDRMFSIIAHDLIAPFNTILGFSSLLLNDYDKYQKEDHEKFAKIINSSSKNIYDLLLNLLHWSRSQLGRIDIKKEAIILNAIVDENIEVLFQTINYKGIHVINNIQSNFEIVADSATMSIVIRNLLSNAIKFTERDGTIDISAEKTNSDYVIRIADNGIGMDKTRVELLFDSSHNDSQPGTENEKGTGLGLSLCKELVNLNNGTITASSVLGEGSVFEISITIEKS